LHWERGGYVIYHKRLECGRISHKVFVKNAVGFRRIRWDEMVLLIEGIAPSVRRRKRFNKGEKVA
ncbi:IS66 family insertion sequence element accessory protein TnpB, partial [Porphyromonas levii]